MNRIFTLLDNFHPILVINLHSDGNYIQYGNWQHSEAVNPLDKSKYSLATAEFIIHNNIEHVDTKNTNHNVWNFNDLLPQHQKMVLDKFPEFLEPLSYIKKISKNKEDLLKNISGFDGSVELLDDETVVLEKYDTISYKKLLSTHNEHLRIDKSNQWARKISRSLTRKIHDKEYEFERYAKQGIDTLKEKFPFADEEMMNLAVRHGYKTSSALTHAIGEMVMPQIMQILYTYLKPYSNQEFNVKLQNNSIYFTTSFENVVNEYKANHSIKPLLGKYKSWLSNFNVDWEKLYQAMDQVEVSADKQAFKDAITGVKKYPEAY